MTFKEQLKADLQQTFFNTEEFGEKHIWDGQEIKAIVDSDDLIAKYSSEFEMLEKGSSLVMAPASEFRKKPQTNAAIIFDGNYSVIDEIKEEAGMYAIVLNAARR